MHFSARTGWDRGEAPLAVAVAARMTAGLPLLDLTVSNPTRCGFTVDAAALLEPLSQAGSLLYEPQPFGRREAREAVSGYYRRHGAEIDPGRICLTTSTSEAYSFLFRLLCDPGDEVLIATPGYPLFSYLAGLNDVRLVEYPLVYEHGWQVEPGSLERLIGPRTRAIMLVHPNNPTGHFINEEERLGLERLCSRHGIALVADEVFLDYGWLGAWPGVKVRSIAAGSHPVLTFVLSGMSKIAAMPQMKLSWLGMLGPPGLVEEARTRLEIIADTYLSVSAPTQQALPSWLHGCDGVQQQIRERVEANLRWLDGLLAGTAASRLQAEGGWYAVLRLPTLGPDEAWAIRLLQRTGVLVHPGSAFGFGPEGWIVLSLLPEPAMFATGVERLLAEAG